MIPTADAGSAEIEMVDKDVEQEENDQDQVEQVKAKTVDDLIVYSADELIELREVGLSQKWPAYLDEGFKNNRGTWDPDRWHQNKRRGSTPPPEDKPTGPPSSAKSNETGPGENVLTKVHTFLKETFQVPKYR